MARLLALFLLWLLLPAAPLLARDLAEIRASGVLRVGVNPNFPPMSSYGPGGQLAGFDVEVARALAARLGVRAELVPTEAAARVPFLVAGRIDVSLGALTITPERQRLIDFSVPLHSEAMGVITTDRVQVTRWQELDRPDITLVNMRGNQSVSVLAEKLPRPQRLLVDGNADTIRAIAQGRADALVENVDFFIGFTRLYPEVRWRVLPEPIFSAWCGVGLAKGNAALRAAIDSALIALHREGRIDALWQAAYGGPMTVRVGPEQLVPGGSGQAGGGAGYRFDWAPVLAQLPYLAGGAAISLAIAVTAFAAGAVLGLGLALARLYGPGWAQRAAAAYGSAVTNTPALVQIFLLYYALPEAGVLLPGIVAVLLGLTLNAAAYLADIWRGGIAALRVSEQEAAAVLGLSPLDRLRFVMLPTIMAAAWRPLGNFFIVLVLGSSMAALFGVEELTGRAINIATANLRTIETFAVTGALYVGLSLVASGLLALIGRRIVRGEG